MHVPQQTVSHGNMGACPTANSVSWKHGCMSHSKQCLMETWVHVPQQTVSHGNMGACPTANSVLRRHGYMSCGDTGARPMANTVPQRHGCMTHGKQCLVETWVYVPRQTLSRGDMGVCPTCMAWPTCIMTRSPNESCIFPDKHLLVLLIWYLTIPERGLGMHPGHGDNYWIKHRVFHALHENKLNDLSGGSESVSSTSK